MKRKKSEGMLSWGFELPEPVEWLARYQRLVPTDPAVLDTDTPERDAVLDEFVVAVKELPARQRKAFELWQEGEGPDRIAHALRCSQANARRLVREARSTVRERIRSSLWAGEDDAGPES